MPRRFRAWPLPLSVLLVAAGGLGAWAWQRSLATPGTIPGLRAGGAAIGGLSQPALDARLAALAGPVLDAPIEFRFGDQRVRARRREAGLRVDGERLAALAIAAGRSGDPRLDLLERRRAQRDEVDLAVPLTVDRGRAIEFLTELKEALDHAARDAHLDLERHQIAPDDPGRLLQVYESLARLEEAVAAGRFDAGSPPIELAAVTTPPRVSKADLESIDIGVVLGTWETHYSAAQTDSDRTYNLKVGAEHLNGHILKPGELFSFNEVVGERTEKEGYRVAPVISGGELIDGLAGGMCQIASTLHAAAFFGGLEIVSATPHSRPSAYIPLGLDATVVYPTTDLKLRNPYDFPIVMHYQVHQGAVKVELLGHAKPRKVVFEREILEEHGFHVETRADPTAPKGQRLLLQEGYPGYRAARRRFLFDGATVLPKALGPPTQPLEALLERRKITPLKVEKWIVHYPPTTEIVAFGSGPKSLPRKPNPPSHHIPAVPRDARPIGRVIR